MREEQESKGGEAEEETLTPKFNLREGSGVPLGQLPCFSSVARRGQAAKALEDALEPLHRLVYGRAGVAGERRAALEEFQGFPAPMQSAVTERLLRMKKSRLCEVSKALGIALRTSDPVQTVAAGVAAFLMAPKDEGRIKAAKSGAAAAASGSKRRRESGATAASTAAPDAKRSRTTEEKSETKAKQATGASLAGPTSSSSAAATAASSSPTSRISDDRVQVLVYRRVLAMSQGERLSLGVKALRTEIEASLDLPSGALKDRRDIITETASDCVAALKAAEDRVLAAIASAALPTSAEEKTDRAAAPVGTAAAPVSERQTEREGAE